MIFQAKVKGGGGVPIAGMGHLISEPKFKLPTPLSPPANFWQVPNDIITPHSSVQGGFFLQNQAWEPFPQITVSMFVQFEQNLWESYRDQILGWSFQVWKLSKNWTIKQQSLCSRA